MHALNFDLLQKWRFMIHNLPFAGAGGKIPIVKLVYLEFGNSKQVSVTFCKLKMIHLLLVILSSQDGWSGCGFIGVILDSF